MPESTRTKVAVSRQIGAMGADLFEVGLFKPDALQGEAIMVPLLIGLGVDELSAAPPLVPQIKYMVRRLKLPEAQALAEFALNSESGSEILAKCQELAWQSAPSLFENKS